MRAWLHPSILSRPIAQSVIFHMLIVALAMVGWPFLSEKDINAQPLIIVMWSPACRKPIWPPVIVPNLARSRNRKRAVKTATTAAPARPAAAAGSQSAATKTGGAQAGS